MSDERNIKGTAFDSVLQDVRARLDSGATTRAWLEARLEPEDLPLLDAKISPAGWYPIDAYARMLEALAELEAGGDRAGYLRRRGAAAAERLHAAGIYPQLDASGEILGLRVLPLVISLASSIYSFTRWSVELEPAETGFRVILDEADGFPDAGVHTAAGFLGHTASRIIERAVVVTSERGADRVVLHAAIESAR